MAICFGGLLLPSARGTKGGQWGRQHDVACPEGTGGELMGEETTHPLELARVPRVLMGTQRRAPGEDGENPSAG